MVAERDGEVLANDAIRQDKRKKLLTMGILEMQKAELELSKQRCR